jgi:hypothetical protein
MNHLECLPAAATLRWACPLAAKAASLCCAILVATASAADTAPPPISAPDLAARLSALQDGANYVRLKMEIKQASGPSKGTVQLQIKERRSKTVSEVVYQVLWPKERKGESVLLRKSANRPPSGTLFVPPNTTQPIDASQMKEPLFGSDLSYEDIIENFFAWDHQAFAGTEVVDGVSCQILESKPGKSEQPIYARVRSWIDLTRIVPLRVEKYLPSGQIVRRISTTRVVKEDKNRWIPASLTVLRPEHGSSTELEGSGNRRGAVFSDSDFTPEGLKEVIGPRPASE